MIYRLESDGEEMSAQLVKLIDEICSKGYSHILLLGDFNYRRIDWDSMSSSVKVETNFLDCLANNYLHQHTDEPTRWRGADKPSLLDLVISACFKTKMRMRELSIRIRLFKYIEQILRTLKSVYRFITAGLRNTRGKLRIEMTTPLVLQIISIGLI